MIASRSHVRLRDSASELQARVASVLRAVVTSAEPQVSRMNADEYTYSFLIGLTTCMCMLPLARAPANVLPQEVVELIDSGAAEYLSSLLFKDSEAREEKGGKVSDAKDQLEVISGNGDHRPRSFQLPPSLHTRSLLSLRARWLDKSSTRLYKYPSVCR